MAELKLTEYKGKEFFYPELRDIVSNAINDRFDLYAFSTNSNNITNVLTELSENSTQTLICALSWLLFNDNPVNSWTTLDMAKNKKLTGFEVNKKWVNKPVCLLYALKKLGAQIEEDTLEKRCSFLIDKTTENRRCGHVMIVRKIEENKWELEDQHGSGYTTDDTLKEIVEAVIEESEDDDITTGYCLIPSKQSEIFKQVFKAQIKV